MNDTELNSTSNMVSAAYNVLNIIENGGMRHLALSAGWTAVNYSACRHENGWASLVVPGPTKATAEVIIEHNAARLSCIVRTYPDGQRRTTWAIGSDMNVGIDAAMAHLTNYYCISRISRLQQEDEARQVETPKQFEDYPIWEDGHRCVEFSEWDRMRRERFDAFNPSFDSIDIVHNEYETCAYYGATGGRIVAQWNSGVGTCSLETIERFADKLAADVRNYIINAYDNGAKS